MKLQQQYLRTVELKDFIKYGSLVGSKANMFQYCKNNSEEHEDTKYKVFKKLIQHGYEVYVESELKNRFGRPDLIAFKEGVGIIIEIQNHELEESIKNKIKKYPNCFDFYVIKCDEPLEEQLCFL